MATLHLSDIETAVRSSWGPDTFLASDEYMALRPELPSRGQCGTTALVVQGLLGGDLMVADVEYEDVVTGVHYWNVTSGGIELDLTNDQFAPGEKLLNPRQVQGERNTAGPGERPYQALKLRVEGALEVMRTGSEQHAR
ncbi:hypothetical protein [Curtobacterium sp. MCSS17_011]|uniref:YunG family protein n=1 Tax=Curtobacterium sp. MCSS17_011 TaxID=2175643 RepID=UPI0011B37020|nr:hypothetical protein [Curtobacterium sp. MCSS17_011]